MKHIHFIATVVLTLYLVAISTGRVFAWENDLATDISSERLANLDNLDLASVALVASKTNLVALDPLNLRLVSKSVNAKKTYNRYNRLASADLEASFNQYADNFNLNPQILKTIAYCESHYNPEAVSSSGTYGGLYQFSASTWASTRNAMGLDPNPELRFDAKEAIMTAAFKIHAGGIGAWPVCGQI